ncbi:hypothetical protein [Paucibacter soli]|uniref:hypothetical protein n=1 Tax=Paucibacter soli TaxID=3133433 RepID=UPI003096AD65
MLTGIDSTRAVAVAQSMALDVLSSIGFDVEDEARVESVMPMMLEAACLVLSDAALRSQKNFQRTVELEVVAKTGVTTLVEVARSRAVIKMVEPAYPADMDSMVALRLTAAAAISQVSVEILEFDFAHTPNECIREAGKVVVKAAMDAADSLSPAQASKASKLMLTQSLIHSAAKLYAATWRAVSLDEIHRLDKLSDPACDASWHQMGETPIATLLMPVNEQFGQAFLAVIETAKDVFAPATVSSAAPSQRRSASPRPR